MNPNEYNKSMGELPGVSATQSIDQTEAAQPASTTPAVPPPITSVSATDPSLEPHSSKYLLIGAISAVVLIALMALFVVPNVADRQAAVKQFATTYSFVPEKLSQSAPIRVNLPDGVSEEEAKAAISFSPVIDGSWLEEEIADTIVFQPKAPLKIGTYYAVNLDAASVQVSGDFYVDEDPQIEAIFPASDSEAHEDTKITIVFNRPMVPLTTLSELETQDLPITIAPETPGRFKWISTRNLQFIPETTLIPASRYQVTIADGLTSVDGLPIAPRTHEFITRPLRYEYTSDRTIIYRTPIIIDFNQPVDLAKTARLISVRSDEGEVAVDVKYGETSYYDRAARKRITEEDQSKLYIYQRRDRHGRSQLWDFDTSYQVAVAGAVPLYGTEALTEGRNFTVGVEGIIKSVTTKSDRSSLVRPDLFDPAGTLEVSFYEDIDLTASDIRVKGVTDMKYGERCATDEEGNAIRVGTGCQLEADRSTIIFSFDPSQFSTSEQFTLELRSIENTEGFEMNPDPITISLTTYPDFAILRTSPAPGARGGSLTELKICSNVPLAEPGEAGLSSYVEASDYIVYSRWSRSRLVYAGSNSPCNSGEFESTIYYGLLPETDYQLSLSLTSEFNQTASRDLAFRTEPAQERYARFHNLQKQYNVTPPERTTLTYGVENLEYVDMHICKMEPETFLRQTIDQPFSTTPPSSTGCTDVVADRVLLPSRYFVVNYFQLDLADYFADTRGHYVVTFSNPLYRNIYRNNEQLYDRTFISVTNLAVGKKQVEYSDADYRRYQCRGDVCEWGDRMTDLMDEEAMAANNLYWVNDIRSLAPVVGAQVTQYSEQLNDTVLSDGRALVRQDGVAQLPVAEGVVGAVVRYGSETAVVTDWADTLRSAGRTRDASRTYIYTDRPIYRPGHTVHIRGIDRVGFDGMYEVVNDEPAPLTIYDSRGEAIYETELLISNYGTFDTSFELPDDAPLGTYRIEVFGHSSSFAVEEYVPAAFKLEAETNEEEYINGDTLSIEVMADYYFGVPLEEGTVSYSVTAQDYYFDRYTDEYFNFGGGWYYCYDCGYGDDFLFRGQTELRDGRAYIERKLSFADFFDNPEEERSKLITVNLTAKDVSGRSVSTQKSFVVHKGEFYLGAKTDQYYTSTNQPLTLRVKTVDTQGESVSLSNIQKTVHKVSWNTFKRQEVDGGYYYRTQKQLEEIASERISTDRNGNWQGELSFADTGQYEVHLTRQDERGNAITSITSVYIYGERAVLAPPNNNYELELETEQLEVEVGDTGSLLIKSPYEKAKVLITAERGTVYDYWIADVTGGLYLHEFPITSEYAPNIFVSALLISGDPEVKYGSVRYEVDAAEKRLEVNVTPNKEHYLPGEEVTLSVETRDHTGRLVPAEVSLAVADLSVLALKGNPKKNPTLFFYDGFPLSVTTASNIKNILYELDIPLGSKGGGGGDPEDLATKKRGLFKDTAYWVAAVETNQNGQATVSFTLPDNLTTWQIEGLGVTQDTKLGVDYREFTTKKDLMAVPLKPRFVIPGDRFFLGATVFNQSDDGATIDVSLESDTLRFIDETSDSIFVNADESKVVYFEVEAPTDIKGGEHVFSFTATGDGFVDSVEQSISITENTTYETTATAHFTDEDRASEYLYIPENVVSGKGGLTINANATLAVFLGDALTYMARYPYGCSEQLASALSSIALVKSALDLPNVEGSLETITHNGVEYSIDEVVEEGLKKIYAAQTPSGAFAYYPGLDPSWQLTVHVALALQKLKEAGFAIDETVLKRAVAAIDSEEKNGMYSGWWWSNDPYLRNEAIIMTEYVLREINGNQPTGWTSEVRDMINDATFMNEKISSMSLAYLAIVTTDGFTRTEQNRVYEALTNRIDIDGRGAYLPTLATANKRFFETPIKNTALLIKAFAAHNDEHPTMGNTLRWLLASRDKYGVWNGTNNTFVVVDALVDFLKWQRETESDFTLTARLDGEELFTTDFTPSNIFDTYTHIVPIDALVRETLLPLSFTRTNRGPEDSNFYYDMSLKYYLPVESLPPRDEGITIARELYALDDVREESPLSEAVVGEVVKGKLTLTIPEEYSDVAVEDIIPAGFEIVNFSLATEDQSLLDETNVMGLNNEVGLGGLWSHMTNWFTESQTAQVFSGGYRGGRYRDSTRTLPVTHQESHDDRIFLYTEDLAPGVYEYEYFLRALVPGEFQHLPARAEQLFFPEVFGRTEGNLIEVVPE